MWIDLPVGWGDLGSTVDWQVPDDVLAEEHELVLLRDGGGLSHGLDAGLLGRGEVLELCGGASAVRSDKGADVNYYMNFSIAG